MLKLVILVIKLIAMNSVNFEQSPGQEYPAVVLDMIKFTQNSSEEHVYGEVEVGDGGVRTIPKIIDCKTEDCTDLGDNSPISLMQFERNEKVRKINIEFVVFNIKDWFHFGTENRMLSEFVAHKFLRKLDGNL